MIFVTVGTTKFPFLRLLRSIDKALALSGLKEKLVVQSGEVDFENFSYPKTTVFKTLPFSKMRTYFSKARLVIAHGGTATIFLSLKYAKRKPLIVPRAEKFSEHVDDHQLGLSRLMEQKNLIQVIFPEDKLVERLTLFLNSSGEKKAVVNGSGLKELVDRLIDYTDKIRS